MASEDNSQNGLDLSDEFLTPGEKFGDHQVMQCLSFDMLCGIYRMQNIRNFEEVCIAVFSQKVCATTDFSDRFSSVGEKLKKLNHPNVLQVTDYSIIDEHYVLQMEPFAGANMVDYLETYVEERQKNTEEGEASTQDIAEGSVKEMLGEQVSGLPALEIKNVIKQAAEAMESASQADVHHYNLNPTSLIRSPEGHVKVSGIGIIEIAGNELVEELVATEMPTVNIGADNILINTLKALSPEVALGQESDEHSDFFGLGYCAYYLLTGKRPEGEYDAPSKISARIPEGWDTFINRCLEKEPSKRHTNARILLNEVERIDRASIPGEVSDDALSRQIERIPLPKNLEKRLNPKKLKIIRLCILGIFAVLVVRLATFSYSVLFKDEQTSSAPIVSLAEEGSEPKLRLAVKPSIAKVTFKGRGSSIYFVLKDGKLNVDIPSGNYTMIIEAKDHKSKMVQLDVGRDPISDKHIRLEPAWALLELSGNPGASVQAINEDGDQFELGVIPDNGVLRVEKTLVTGNYNIIVSLPNYLTLTTESILLPLGELKEHAVSLAPAP